MQRSWEGRETILWNENNKLSEAATEKKEGTMESDILG